MCRWAHCNLQMISLYAAAVILCRSRAKCFLYIALIEKMLRNRFRSSVSNGHSSLLDSHGWLIGDHMFTVRRNLFISIKVNRSCNLCIFAMIHE